MDETSPRYFPEDKWTKEELSAKVKVGTTINRMIWETLRFEHARTGVPINRLIEDAISNYIGCILSHKVDPRVGTGIREKIEHMLENWDEERFGNVSETAGDDGPAVV